MQVWARKAKKCLCDSRRDPPADFCEDIVSILQAMADKKLKEKKKKQDGKDDYTGG